MSTLQTKSGLTVFKAQVIVDGVELVKEGDKVKAVHNGEVIGTVVGETVVADGKKIKIESLKSAINPADLVGKDPTTLSNEELVALTQYLTDLAAGKIKAAPAAAETKPAKKEKPAAKKSVKKEVVEVAEEDEEEAELPEGVESYEDLEKLGAKELWAIAKPLGIDGINSRTKKTPLLEALAAFFDLEVPADEEEEDIDEDELEEVLEEEGEEEYEDDEEEDEDFEDEEEDDEDYEDEEEEEEDEDEFDDDDSDDESDDDEEDEEDDEDYEDDEEEDADEVSEKDIDALFAADNKEAIVAFCKKHGVTIPKRKLTKQKLKQIIKDQILGEE